jgi:hypothetical protein
MEGMARRFMRLVALAGLMLSGAPVQAEDAEVTFRGLLEESGMILQCDEGYVALSRVANDLLPYEKALRTDDGSMEIRFAIRPLSRITIDYDDPHNAAPEPEHLFPLLFQSLTESLSGGRHSPHREYTAEQARELFNADWAAASTFDVAPEFKTDYRHGFMVAVHGVGKADAYTVMLFDDYAASKAAINAALKCLVFRPADPEEVMTAE